MLIECLASPRGFPTTTTRETCGRLGEREGGFVGEYICEGTADARTGLEVS